MLHNTSVNIDLICLNGSITTVQKIWQLKLTLLRTKITLLKLKAYTQKYKQSSNDEWENFWKGIWCLFLSKSIIKRHKTHFTLRAYRKLSGYNWSKSNKTTKKTTNKNILLVTKQKINEGFFFSHFFSICKNKAKKIIPHATELFENLNQSWLSKPSYNNLELQVANGHIPTTSTLVGPLWCTLQPPAI